MRGYLYEKGSDEIKFVTLHNATEQLEKSLKYAHSEMAKNDEGLFEQFRNSVVQ